MLITSAGVRPTETPPKTSRGVPFIRKQNGKLKWFYTECDFHPIVHFMHIRVVLMSEPDGYVFTQNAIASDFASTYPIV